MGNLKLAQKADFLGVYSQDCTHFIHACNRLSAWYAALASGLRINSFQKASGVMSVTGVTGVTGVRSVTLRNSQQNGPMDNGAMPGYWCRPTWLRAPVALIKCIGVKTLRCSCGVFLRGIVVQNIFKIPQCLSVVPACEINLKICSSPTRPA